MAFTADGTEVTVGLHISDKERSGLAVWILRTLLAFGGIMGSVMSFVSVIYPYESTAPFIIAAAAACVLALAASLLKKYGKLIIAASYAVYAVSFFRLRDTISTGFMRTANIYLSTVRMRYKDVDYFDISHYEGDISEAARTFLIMAALLIAMTAAFSVIYKTSFTCVFLVTFPPAELLLYYGLVPGYIWIALLISCWLGSAAAEFAEFPVAGIGNDLPVYRRVSSQAAAAAAAVLLISFFFSDAVLDFSGYKRPDEFDDFKTKFSRYIKDFSWKKFTNDIDILRPSKKEVSGAVSHGKLGRQDTVAFNNEKVLTVKLPKTAESVYLKSFTGINYTGNSWLEENKDQLSMKKTAASGFKILDPADQRTDGIFIREYSAFKGNDLSASVIDISKNDPKDKYVYLPYMTVPGSDTSYSAPQNYSTEFYMVRASKLRTAAEEIISGIISPSEISEEFAYDEKLYRKYVRETCLDFPEAFTAPDYIFSDIEAADAVTETDRIRDWLEMNCTYDLSAGRLPFGEDFAQHFVVASKRGSCTHFATAAALMCRYRGIPARYCEGYIIKPEDFPSGADYGEIVETEISDTRAHAWIEIYIDGMGWYPCEMTPGYGNTIIEESSAETSSQSSADTESMTEPDEEDITEESETITETEKITTEKPVTETSESTDKSTETSSRTDTVLPPPTEPEQKPFGSVPLYSAVGAAAFCAAVYLRYLIALKHRKRIYSNGTANEKSLLACRDFMKICAFLGLKKEHGSSYDEFAVTAAEKLRCLETKDALAIINSGLAAEFGRSGADNASADAAAAALEKFASSAYAELNTFKKFVFRFIYCLC